MFTGMQGFFGGLGGQGQGSAPRAGKYDQFGRPIAPQSMSSDLGGMTNIRGDDQAMGIRGSRYDQFGRPLAPGSGTVDSGPKRTLLPAPGVVYPRPLRTQPSNSPGAARVTSAPVGPSKEAMIEHACRPIMKVDKTSSHYPWAEEGGKKTSQLMPPPLMPGFDPPGRSRGDQSDRDQRNRPAVRLDRPGLGFGEDYDRGDPGKRRDIVSRSNDPSRARSPDRRSSDRKGRVDVRFEGRGLRDLYQDNDFGKGRDKSDDRRSDDRRSDSRDGGRRKDDDRGRSSERRDRGRDRDNRDQKSGSRSRDDTGRSGGSWDGDRRDSSEEDRRKERLEQQRNRQAQRSNSMQDIGQVDDFDSAWQKASTATARDQDLFGSTPSSAQSAWWTSCTICKTNFRYKEEFTAHVDEPLHYINLEKVRKEHAKEKAVKKVANVAQTASAVESIIYHCKICNISLNGWANFNQHVSSQIHLVHFIKNVGPKGDPKGLEYFEVSDRDAPEADGRNHNNAASLLTDWRRCKCCNMEIPSWEDPHMNCPNRGKINKMGIPEDPMADDASGEPPDDSRERSCVLPEELNEKKKALGPAIFLFIRESLTRSNFPGMTHEVPAMVPSEVSTLAAELISSAQKYPMVEPGNLIVGAVVNGVKLYMTRKKRKGWKCWTSDIRQVQDRLRVLVTFCGGQTTDLEDKFKAMLELAEPEGVSKEAAALESTQVEKSIDMFRNEDNDLRATGSPTLLKELKNSLTKLMNGHIQSTFSKIPCRVPPKVPKAVFTAAENLNVQDVKLGQKSGNAVTAAIINALKLKENFKKTIRGKLSANNVHDMFDSLQRLVSMFGGDKEHLKAGTDFSRYLDLTHDAPTSADTGSRKIEKEVLKEPNAHDPSDNLVSLKAKLVDAVSDYIQSITTNVPARIPPAVPPRMLGATRALHSYIVQKHLTADHSIVYAVRDGMVKAFKPHLPRNFTVSHVTDLKESFGAMVTRFGDEAAKLKHRFDKLLELAKDPSEPDATIQPPGTDLPWLSRSTGMSNPDAFHEDMPLRRDSTPQQELRRPEFADIQKTLKKMLVAYFRAVVAGGDDYVTSEETKLEIFTAAKELDSYDVSCAGAPGSAVAIAIQRAARTTSFKAASIICIQGIKDSMVSLVETLGGTFPARLAERFDACLTVARIRETESQADGMQQRTADSRRVVGIDIATSDGKDLSDVEAEAGTSKADDTAEMKEPDVLPNDVFRKKIAVRVAVFRYLKDHLQGLDIPEKSSMVPENVYTAVTVLYSSAVEKNINPGPVVTGAIVAAVEFVIKRLANQSWKFTGAAVQDVKGRLDNLVSSFGGDPNDIAPVYDMVMKFAKDNAREATQPTRDPSKEASKGKNEPTPSKTGQRSREKINFSLKKEEEEEKICTGPDAAFEGTKILPVSVVQKKTDFGIGVDKFCKQLLLSKDYSTGIDSNVPFAVSGFLKDLGVKLVDSARKRASGCDVGDVITSAMAAGVNTFCEGRSENWRFNSSAAVYDLKARLKNFLTIHDGYPAKLDEVFSKLLDLTENKGLDISEIEDLSYDEIVQLEGLLGLGDDSDMEGLTVPAPADSLANPGNSGQDIGLQNEGFSLSSQEPAQYGPIAGGGLTSNLGSGPTLGAKMPEVHKLKMSVFTYLRIKLLNLEKKAIVPNRAAEELASFCLKFGADVGLTITSSIVQGIRLVTDRVKEGWKKDISQIRSELKPHFACITELVGKFNGNGFKVREQIRFLLDEIDGSAKAKWYIRKVERLQKIASLPGFQKLKNKATERYKLHLRTQQHLDNTISDLLREVIQEETDFIKKQAANGKEKNVEDIERNRKAFWETQMPLNHIRPSQGQMDDAYSTFLKEAGIDNDNRQGDSNNSQSTPHYREQRGGLQQQKSEQGRQQSGRRQDNRGPDGGGGYDYSNRQQTSSSSQQGGSNRFDQAQESLARPSSSSSTGGGLSSQGQSVLNLFDKFLMQTGGEKLSNSQSQGQGQDNQASKLLDTIQQKLENIGDVEDDSAINMILDRVLDEYKALKSGGSQPVSQAQAPPSSVASAMSGGQVQSSLLQIPGGTMQDPGMQMQQQLQDMQMQQQLQQLQGMQSGQTSMVRPFLVPTPTSMLMPPTVSRMQPPPMRLMQPVQSNMQPQMMPPQTGPNQQGQMNLNQQGNQNRNQSNRNQQGQGNRNQGQPNRNQQGNQANRNQQGQLNRNQHGQSSRDEPGRGEHPGKMKALLAASLAATLAGKDKKQGMSESTQNKLSAVLRSLNERLEPGQRKRPSRWSSEDTGPEKQQDRHVSPERKRPRDRSPDQGRGGPNNGDRRPTRFNERPDGKRDLQEAGRGNHGGPPMNMHRKDEWMNEMKSMHGKQMGGPRMPGAGGPRGAGPIKSLLPQPRGDMAQGPRMNMPGPGGPGMRDNGGPNTPIDLITALYGDIMNILAPGSVNTPQEMSVATEMIASLSQAMACVLNNIYSPESQVKIQQSAQKFKLAFGNHPLVQAFFSATSVPPDVIQLLAKLDPMLQKRVVIVLQQARKDIQQQALQSAVFLEKFMVNSNLRM
ncbi:uncharacterized protein LOC135487482 isoform X2 [Lineus longissimus]|uniref:uncharacterized protein LOC135487482 isoform X2 n=1 Tax=Lineus longissimus TaxID=88925 RepID=UPI002B4E1DF7